MVKKQDPKLEQKLKELEFKKQKLLEKKINEKYYKIENKYKTKSDEFFEKIICLINKEKDSAKRKIERQVDNWHKNQIRKAKGRETIKYATKEKSIAKIKYEYLSVLQKYVRLRDSRSDGYGECISCLAAVHRKKGHGGHFISRMHNSVAFDLRNISLQCIACNKGLHGNYAEYRKNLIKKIGLSNVEELESLKYKAVSLDREWMIKQIEIYKQECIRLESLKQK